MPHLLIAGSTGSGKSVCINTLIISILYKAKPDEVKLIMIDPKVVELSVYNGIPHLFIPVVTDPKKAAGALNWAVNEMSNRYNTFAEYGVRNLEEFNRKGMRFAFWNKFDRELLAPLSDGGARVCRVCRQSDSTGDNLLPVEGVGRGISQRDDEKLL